MAKVTHRELFGPDHFDDPYYQSIVGVLRALDPKPQRGLDIGFCWGMSARAFLEETGTIGGIAGGVLRSLDTDDQMGKLPEFEHYGRRFSLALGDSSGIMHRLALLGEKFDWIYVDGDHEYAGVKKDLEAALPLLAPGGVMMCDDYGNPCGVKQAVDEFVRGHGLIMTSVDRSPSGAVIVQRAN